MPGYLRVQVGGIGIAPDANEAGSVATRFTLPLDVPLGVETSPPCLTNLGRLRDSKRTSRVRHQPI